MRHALSLAVAVSVVMLVTTSATAQSRVFISAAIGVPVHPHKLTPRPVIASRSFLTVSPFHSIPQAAIVSTLQRAIRPGTPVMVTRPSTTFVARTVLVLSPVQGAPPHPITVPRSGVVPKVLIVVTTDSTRQR
jgi:hypothetical protein